MDMDLDQFLKHSGRSEGGKYLKDWKEKGQIDVWLHRAASFTAIWRHGVPNIVEPKADSDKAADGPQIWNSNVNCLEHEDVLKNQHKRNRDTGVRDMPPERCPICRLIDWVRLQVVGGKLSWVEPIFDWQVGEGRSAKQSLIHAGGLYNAFGSPKLDKEQIADMREQGISQKEAWKENIQAKLQYIFVVVADNDPKAGAQIAIQPALLGDRVKILIQKEIESKDKLGNPLLNPYCLRWKYNEHAKNFGEKYDALRIDKIPLRPEIEEQISKMPPPDTSALKAPAHWGAVKANLMGHCLLDDVPWDEFFAGVKLEESRAESDEDTSFDHGANVAPAPPPAAAVPAPAPAAVAPPATPPSEMMVACDNEKCGKAIKITDPKCAHCGMLYEQEAPPAQMIPPPPPPLPKRSAVKAAAQPTAAPAASPIPPDEKFIPGDDMAF